MRRFSIILVGFLLLVILAIGGFALIPPSAYTPPRRDLRDESEFDLNEKVGWYLFDDSSYQMITWGAENGLTLNRFDKIASDYLKPVSKDIYKWERNTQNYRLKFHRDQNGKIIDMTWEDEKEQHHTAKRLNSYAYSQVEVHYFNGDIELVGLLMTPVSDGPHPAVAFIHGSGVSDRDNFWYLYQADFLAKRGIVVLLPDKRGCGKSAGEWHTASFDDFAEDALASIRFLQNVEGVAPRQTGLLGLSQGGWIAPLAATKSPNVNFVINVSGSATTPNEQIRHEVAADIRNSGAPAFLAHLLAPIFANRAKNRRHVWWDKNGDFDPVEYWNRLSIPVLIVYGKKDESDNVPVGESITRLESAKHDSKNSRFTIEIYEDSGHAMGDVKTGWIREDYLELLVNWIYDVSGISQ